MPEKKPARATQPADAAFSSEAIAMQTRPPLLIARMVSLALCAIAVLSIVYAFLNKVDIVVTAQGRVIPSGRSKVIQPIDAGVVRSIAVRDGQKVTAGEILVELDPTNTSADRDRLQRELWEAEADVARQSALMLGQTRLADTADMAGMPQELIHNQQAMLVSRLTEHQARVATLKADVERRHADRDAINANLDQLKLSLPLVRRKNETREELARLGHISEAGLIDTRLELINIEKEVAVQQNRQRESQAALRTTMLQAEQADAEFRARTSADLLEATKRREAARQELIKANQRRDLQVLRSPINGLVQQLAVTTVGGVVTQAQALMTIVPENTPLEVDAQVLNADAGHVKAGQRAINKVETFDFTRYGYLEGEVLWVGTDAVTDSNMGPVYPVRIRLTETITPSAYNGARGVITAGMNITSEIRVGQRRLIDFFLSPLLRYQQEALRER